MDKVHKLIQQGAIIPDPRSVIIGDEVGIERISANGVTLYPGTRIFGDKCFIGQGAKIGEEGPSTVENCFVGPYVGLKGGYFSKAVFLYKASCGLGAHIRQGTIIEEEASIAHTVGLKQTILFPFVTLGSLINFCDCLMAGGTSRSNHSEVGSSYIHFNFTPNQDKATPSIMGDVPKGVMLNQPPIFLGGQGGMVGPCRIAYGTVIAAGTICRNDQIIENQLVFGEKPHSGRVPYLHGIYHGLKRILYNNFIYIGNLYALRQWYTQVRRYFIGSDFPLPLFEGLSETLDGAIKERILQLKRLSQNFALTKAEEGLRFEIPAQWDKIESVFEKSMRYEGLPAYQESFMKKIENMISIKGKSYLQVVQGLDSNDADIGTKWMESIVFRVVTDVNACLSSMKQRKLDNI
jgi:UDP-N-acetylglucosamine/UDP-N-acetylgalactosamine diphosphorylase